MSHILKNKLDNVFKIIMKRKFTTKFLWTPDKYSLHNIFLMLTTDDQLYCNCFHYYFLSTSARDILSTLNILSTYFSNLWILRVIHRWIKNIIETRNGDGDQDSGSDHSRQEAQNEDFLPVNSPSELTESSDESSQAAQGSSAIESRGMVASHWRAPESGTIYHVSFIWFCEDLKLIISFVLVVRRITALLRLCGALAKELNSSAQPTGTATTRTGFVCDMDLVKEREKAVVAEGRQEVWYFLRDNASSLNDDEVSFSRKCVFSSVRLSP